MSGPIIGHDLDQADERADEQPVVEADDVEAGRQYRSDREHHQEAEPRVRAEAAVEREVGLPRLVALRLGCERGEQLDDRVALGDAVPGGGEREEDRDEPPRLPSAHTSRPGGGAPSRWGAGEGGAGAR